MQILLVAATSLELKPLAELAGPRFVGSSVSISKLITGVGLLASGYALTRAVMNNRPNLVVAAGIGGSFDERLKPGAVARIESESIADLGAQETDGFKDVFDLGLAEANTFPFDQRTLKAPVINQLLHLPGAKGSSINEITTREERIKCVQAKYNSQVESMEGAAIHYVCLQFDIPFIHLRAISNFVGERDKSKWKMREAIQNLNHELQQLLFAVADQHIAY